MRGGIGNSFLSAFSVLHRSKRFVHFQAMVVRYENAGGDEIDAFRSRTGQVWLLEGLSAFDFLLR